MRRLYFAVQVAILFFCPADPSAGDDSPNQDVRIAEALRITTDAAKDYDFSVEGTAPHKLAMHPNSILRWSNPIAGEVYGNVFVWTYDGRPEVIGSILQWYTPHTHGSHEFHSLTDQPVSGEMKGRSVWEATQGGVTRKQLPDRPTVGATALLRLRQMRAISRQFEIQKTDRENTTSELRLLAQPVYRYGAETTGVIDGALFVFVEGTDPETFLTLEARDVGGQTNWYYALTRMNSVQFVAEYQSKEVWRVEHWSWGKTKNAREPYTHFGPFHRAQAGK